VAFASPHFPCQPPQQSQVAKPTSRPPELLAHTSPRAKVITGMKANHLCSRSAASPGRRPRLPEYLSASAVQLRSQKVTENAAPHDYLFQILQPPATSGLRVRASTLRPAPAGLRRTGRHWDFICHWTFGIGHSHLGVFVVHPANGTKRDEFIKTGRLDHVVPGTYDDNVTSRPIFQLRISANRFASASPRLSGSTGLESDQK
jgi:hypothetical protein